jgi:UDP-glucose 4-epimerase
MHILITGGAGFIGSHLTEYLTDSGHAVTILDDLSTGAWENLAPQALRRVTQAQGSVLDAPLVSALAQRADAIIHLASVVGVRRVLERPLESMDVIVHGTRHVLDAACSRGCPVLLTSSSEVYGNGTQRPSHESSACALGAAPRWIYAAAKLIDDMVLQAMARERGLRGVSARLFNVVGPRQRGDYGMVLPRFVRAALRGQPITVYGDGLQTRTFAHVADIVPALYALLTCPQALDGRTVNLGSAAPISIRHLAERVRARVDDTIEITHVDPSDAMPPGFEEIRDRVPDTSLAQRLIGFRCARDLDAILDDVIQHERAFLAQPTPDQRPLNTQ